MIVGARITHRRFGAGTVTEVREKDEVVTGIRAKMDRGRTQLIDPSRTSYWRRERPKSRLTLR